METLLVFPYFLVKFLTRLGVADNPAIILAAILSTTCVVAAVVALFHRRALVKVTMVGVAWCVIALSVTGFVWECRAARPGQPGSAVPTQEQMPADHEYFAARKGRP
jgi:hypothetical protein